MQSSPAISAPSPTTAPLTLRAAQRSNKSGQSQSNNARHAQRSPEQTHARHQSMPSHQRTNAHNTKPDMTNVTILKRSSATPASKGASPKVSAPVSDKQQQQQQQRVQSTNQKPRPQSLQQQQLVKTRRVQRRKEIEAESLVQVDIDMALHQSPPLDPTSPPSSSDSDDSESAMSRLPDNVLASRRFRQLAGHLPQRANSAPAEPQLRRGHQDVVDTKPRQGDFVYPSRASVVTFQVQRPNAPTKSNSADKVMLVEKKSTLYAGPTFHNSPAPESLPIPVFARSAGNSPIEPSAPFFAEAASPQLNSTRPLAMQSPAPGWYGHYSMPTALNNVPDRMATSSFSQHNDHLMEITQNLRMLLKIQTQ